MIAGTLKTPIGDQDHILGSPTATLELVEYGDYECPHCGRAAPVVQQLVKEYGDQIKFAFRHFPLAKMHPHARKAAQAAEAVGAQGKFWDMHELLFQNAAALELANLIEYAGRLELDTSKFETELVIETYAPRVQEDVAGGVRSGVNGTPTFFINGKRHNAGYTFDELKYGLLSAVS